MNFVDLRSTVLLLALIFATFGCQSDTQSPWNSPYPDSQIIANTQFSSFSSPPNHLDPAQSYSSNETVFTAQIYEPPLQYHFLKRPYQLIPLTAEAMPTVKFYREDGSEMSEEETENELPAYSEYEVRIRSGIQYQPHPCFAQNDDGDFRYHNLSASEQRNIRTLADFPETDSRELTADDYIYQLKRLAHPGLHSPIYGLMTSHIVGLKDLGDKLRAAYKSAREAGEEEPFLTLGDFELSGVTKVDRYTYRIRVNSKYPQFLYWLAMPFFAPVPEEAERFYHQQTLRERNITLDWFPVGTGPFMLTVNNPNKEMILEKNPNYHGETYPTEGDSGDAEAGLLDDAGKELPLIDRAVYKLEKEGIPYWNKFLQGYYDASGISSESFDQAVGVDLNGDIRLTDRMKDMGISLLSSVGTATYYMGFNMLDPVVGGLSDDKRKLRQAISIAIDYEEFISIFTNGRGIPAQGPLPPGIFGYVEGEEGINPLVYEWKDGVAQRRSVEDARKLMEEAGYKDGIDPETGKPLVLYFDVTGSGPDTKAELDWMRKQFRKIGIELLIRNTDYNRFQEKMLNGNAQIFRWGWLADYPDPENFLFLLYGPSTKALHKGENAANYQSAEFDKLFTVMKSMNNSPKRAEIVQEMVSIVRKDAPWIFGMHPLQFSLIHDWVHNVKPNQMANNTLKYRRISPLQRFQSQRAWNKPVWWPPAAILALLALLLIPAWIGYQKKMKRGAI